MVMPATSISISTILLLIVLPAIGYACQRFLDLQTSSSDTNAIQNNAIQNPNTNYYTIAGSWTPSFSPQSCSEWPIDYPGWIYLGESANDGAVPIWSVESSKQPYFHNLAPSSPHCHQDLLGDEEFKLAEPILLGKQ